HSRAFLIRSHLRPGLARFRPSTTSLGTSLQPTRPRLAKLITKAGTMDRQSLSEWAESERGSGGVGEAIIFHKLTAAYTAGDSHGRSPAISPTRVAVAFGTRVRIEHCPCARRQEFKDFLTTFAFWSKI